MRLLVLLLLAPLAHSWELEPAGDKLLMRGEVWIGEVPAEDEPDERLCRPCTVEHTFTPDDSEFPVRDREEFVDRYDEYLRDPDRNEKPDPVGDADEKEGRDRSVFEKGVLANKARLEALVDDGARVRPDDDKEDRR